MHDKNNRSKKIHKKSTAVTGNFKFPLVTDRISRQRSEKI